MSDIATLYWQEKNRINDYRIDSKQPYPNRSYGKGAEEIYNSYENLIDDYKKLHNLDQQSGFNNLVKHIANENPQLSRMDIEKLAYNKYHAINKARDIELTNVRNKLTSLENLYKSNYPEVPEYLRTEFPMVEAIDYDIGNIELNNMLHPANSKRIDDFLNTDMRYDKRKIYKALIDQKANIDKLKTKTTIFPKTLKEQYQLLKPDKNKFYRMIGGLEGYEDAAKTLTLRQPGDTFRGTYFNRGMPDKSYMGPYMVEYSPEIKNIPEQFERQIQNTTDYYYTKNKQGIPINSKNTNFYRVEQTPYGKAYVKVEHPLSRTSTWPKALPGEQVVTKGLINKNTLSKLSKYGAEALNEAALPLTILDASESIINLPSKNPTVSPNKYEAQRLEEAQVNQMYIDEAKKHILKTEGPQGLNENRINQIASQMKSIYENQQRSMPQLKAR